MGITSFLGRKAAPADDVSSFKAQPYGSTVGSLPPVLGTNPIPGNGVNAIGSNGIQPMPRKKSRPALNLNASQSASRTSILNPKSPGLFRGRSSSPAAHSFHSAAPPPVVPRLRFGSSGRRGSGANFDRPVTAPDEIDATTGRPKSSGKTDSISGGRSRRDSFRQSISFLKKSGSHGELQRTDSFQSDLAPPVPPIPSAHSPSTEAAPQFPRAASVLSGGALSSAKNLSISTKTSYTDSMNRGPGYVDLLDASSEFRPSNFRSRVQATGVRDYGEDVAERNILPGETSTNTVSSPSKSSYHNYSTSNAASQRSAFSNSTNLEEQRPRTITFPKRVDSHDPTIPAFHKQEARRKDKQPQREVDEQEELDDDDEVETAQALTSKFSAPKSKPRSITAPAVKELSHVSASGSKHRPTPLELKPLKTSLLELQHNASESDDSAAPPDVPRQRESSRKTRRDSHRPDERRGSHASPRKSKSSRQGSVVEGSAPRSAPPKIMPSEIHDFGFGSPGPAIVGGKKRWNAEDGRTRGYESRSATHAPEPAVLRTHYSSPKSSGRRKSSPHKSRQSSPHKHHRSKRNGSSRPTSSSSTVPGHPNGSSSSRRRAHSSASTGLGVTNHPNLSNITEIVPDRNSSRRNWSVSSSTPPHSASDFSAEMHNGRPHSRLTAETSIAPTSPANLASFGNAKEVMGRSGQMDRHNYSTSYTSPKDYSSNHHSRSSRIQEPVARSRSPLLEFGQNLYTDDDFPRESGLLFREDTYTSALPGLSSAYCAKPLPEPTQRPPPPPKQSSRSSRPHSSHNKRATSPTPSEWSIDTMTYDQGTDVVTPLRSPHASNAKRMTFPKQHSSSYDKRTSRARDTSSCDGGSDYTTTTDSELDARLEAKLALRLRRELKKRAKHAAQEPAGGRRESHGSSSKAASRSSRVQYA